MAAPAASTIPPVSHATEFWLSKKFAINLFLVWTLLVSLPFSLHAVTTGLGYYFGDSSSHISFRNQVHSFTVVLIASHMFFLGMMHILGNVQLLYGMNGKSKSLVHRYSGMAFFFCTIAGTLSGSIYVTVNGMSDGGAGMHAEGINTNSNAIYTVIFLYCAYKGIESLVNKNYKEHKEWAIRLFFMGISSWFFRVIHANWYLAMGDLGAGTAWKHALVSYGFYLIPLLGIEIVFRMQRAGLTKKMPKWTPLAMSLVAVTFMTTGAANDFIALF